MQRGPGSSARIRTWVALGCLALITLALVVLSNLPSSGSPWPWRWQDLPAQPFSLSSPTGGALSVLPGTEAAYAAELLASAGTLGLGIEQAQAGRPWLLPTGACDSLEAALATSLSDGGGVTGVVATPCAGLEAMGIGAPVSYSKEGAATQPVAGSDLVLPLPAEGAEWMDLPPGWKAVARRAGGGVVLARSAQGITVASFDVVPFLRLLRQGDPGWANQDRDGIHGPKPNDLMPFPWDERVYVLPGSDLWVEFLWSLAGKIPRLWPLPSEAKSAVILTFDQDFALADWLDPLLARVELSGGEATLLTTAGTRQSVSAPLREAGGELPSAARLDEWAAWGHGVGLHPNVVGLSGPKEREEAIELFAAKHPEARVLRNHFCNWWGYEAMFEIQASLGIWMDLNYLSIEPRFRPVGFLNQAARPTRFQGRDGRFLPVLLQSTQVSDDVLYGEYPYSNGLSLPEAILATGEALDRAVALRVPLTFNLHPMIQTNEGAAFLDGLLAAAGQRNVPVISAERWAAHSWARLARSYGQPTPEKEPPLLRWIVGGDCSEKTALSPFAGGGCLAPVRQQQSVR